MENEKDELAEKILTLPDNAFISVIKPWPNEYVFSPRDLDGEIWEEISINDLQSLVREWKAQKHKENNDANK